MSSSSTVGIKVHHLSPDQLKGHVLLIEDDELTANWLMREMSHKGLTCTWVKTKDDAEAILKTQRFHAAVTDVYLEDGKSGLQLIKSLEMEGLPVVVITSKADLQIAKDSLNQGASYLLEKPFDPAELFKMLEKVWDEPRGLNGVMERFFELNHFTPKEKEIARLVLKGLSNREIAEVMGNTEKTIKFHLTVIFQKCAVKSRTEFFNAIFPT